jgi:DNA primase
MSGEIELIKERLDISELVSEYVPLRRAGTHFKGLCPFHQEKTPSFIVSPQKGIWHCFGCGEGGDAFKFIQKIEGLDFPAALKLLAERTGVTLKHESGKSRDERQRLFDLLQLTARFYHEVLVHQPGGKRALDYLAKRGVHTKTITDFQLGYASTGWDSLQQWLQKKGYSVNEMIAAGVVGRAESGRYFDRFRGRIIFPIRDLQGRVIAFGGRITPFTETGREGKYINSPETRLYSKRHTIYNLDRAKHALRGKAACIVVEGYMDVIMLAQAGITNVVASSGTAFTAEHMHLLSRFTPILHFAFDADPAGWKAAVTATTAALAAGMRVATIQFPAGKDPADLVVEAPDSLPELLQNPRSLVSIMIEHLRTSRSVAAPVDTDTLLQQVVPLIALVAHPIQQGEMIQEVATSLHVPEDRIIALIQRQSAPVPLSINVADQVTVRDAVVFTLSPEQQLLGLFLVDVTARREVFPQVASEVLLDSDTLQLYKMLHRLVSTRADFFDMTAPAILQLLPAEQLTFAEGLRSLSEERVSQLSGSPVAEAHSLLRALQRRHLERQLRLVQEQLTAAKDDERPAMLEQFQSLAEELERVRAQA